MAYNRAVEDIQDVEYPMLKDKTYLDHGGTTIYAKSLIEQVASDLVSNLYGNPHSASDPAHLSGHRVDETREKALRFFGADPEEFDLVFVANATAGIKLVMESFKDLGNATRTPDGKEGGFRYLYHIDCHNSLVGVREATDENHYCFRNDSEVEDWLSGTVSRCAGNKLGLFGFPAQSNMTGRRLPLSWPGKIRQSTLDDLQDTYTLLDAAALATTYPLHSIFSDPDLAPDFTTVSFYKIFGYPDLGALIVRKASGNILRWGRKYFGGGTVEAVAVLGNKPWFKSRRDLHSSLEDGTLPFHNIFALDTAIDVHERLYGPDPMARISQHTTFLAQWLYNEMTSLVHPSGVPVCKIYTDGRSNYGNSYLQGSTIAFNILRNDGRYIPFTSIVETLANRKKIYVRSGTLCNPGGIATHLGYGGWQTMRLWEDGHRCSSAAETGSEIVKGKPTGVVRVSLGAMTTMANMVTMINFLKDEFMVAGPVQLSRLVLSKGVGDDNNSKPPLPLPPPKKKTSSKNDRTPPTPVLSSENLCSYSTDETVAGHTEVASTLHGFYRTDTLSSTDGTQGQEIDIEPKAIATNGKGHAYGLRKLWKRKAKKQNLSDTTL
ncbi:molybdenum cofactor sulfurase [Phlyctema vagabunda]|uniref:Molybdenum cofactor sulfurase n=1 Tax=Phlyctema vagabunda TaxID=108571 RepID=A0ABR4PH87_9HELO